jgi:hypothetical protein
MKYIRILVPLYTSLTPGKSPVWAESPISVEWAERIARFGFKPCPRMSAVAAEDSPRPSPHFSCTFGGAK